MFWNVYEKLSPFMFLETSRRETQTQSEGEQT